MSFKKILFLALLALVLLPAVPAMAQGTPAAGGAAESPAIPAAGLIGLGVGIGLGLIIIGAGKGIGAIGSHAVDAIARQPEAGGRIFTSMIIAAALIEGATLFAIVVALLLNNQIAG
jgi:F-type H+-transporting ATPase subunit c